MDVWGQRRWGSHVQLADSAVLHSPGPDSAAGLFNWPSDLAKNLFRAGNLKDQASEGRLADNLAAGVRVLTDYSGFDCPREALEVGFECICRHTGWRFTKETLKDSFEL